MTKHTEERTKTHACDCISRQAVSDIIKTRLYQTALNNDEYITSYAKVCEDIAENRIDTWINEAKSVEPERKTGKWEYTQYDGNPKIGNWHCSECRLIVNLGFEGTQYYHYCPNCGAKMEVQNE